MARPKKEKRDARTVVVGIRLTIDERATLEERAAAASASLSDFARAAVLGGPVEIPSQPVLPPVAPSPAGVAHVVALNRVGVNLNQIARALNSTTGFIPHELDDALRRVNDLLDDWQGVRA